MPLDPLDGLNRALSGGATANTNQVTVTTSATQIIAANSSRKRIVLSAATAFFLGGSNAVTATTGLLVPANTPVVVETYTGALFGIVGTGSVAVSYLEEAP